jgi:hypothetical protein
VGGLKHLEYGNAVKTDLTFDAALRPETYKLQKTGDIAIMQKNYEYYTDGQLKYTEDDLNGVFDRLQTYDHQGRVMEGKSGLEARGGTVTTGQDAQLPYRQNYSYNAFDNLTQRNKLTLGYKHLGRCFQQFKLHVRK